MSAAAGPSTNPYVGPRPFQTGERLFGRDEQLRQLTGQLLVQRIVLLFGPDGAGKTSLIQAGLIPELQAERFQVFPVARLSVPIGRTELKRQSLRTQPDQPPWKQPCPPNNDRTSTA